MRIIPRRGDARTWKWKRLDRPVGEYINELIATVRATFRVFKRARRLMRFQQLREVAGDMPEDEALALAQVVAEDVRHRRFF